MKMDVDFAVDSLARLIQVISKDRALREQLAKLSPVQRANQIHVMAEQMAADGKDPEIVAIFRLFGDARVFDAGMLALRECRSGRS